MAIEIVQLNYKNETDYDQIFPNIFSEKTSYSGANSDTLILSFLNKPKIVFIMSYPSAIPGSFGTGIFVDMQSSSISTLTSMLDINGTAFIFNTHPVFEQNSFKLNYSRGYYLTSGMLIQSSDTNYNNYKAVAVFNYIGGYNALCIYG